MLILNRRPNKSTKSESRKAKRGRLWAIASLATTATVMGVILNTAPIRTASALIMQTIPGNCGDICSNPCQSFEYDNTKSITMCGEIDVDGIVSVCPQCPETGPGGVEGCTTVILPTSNIEIDQSEHLDTCGGGTAHALLEVVDQNCAIASSDCITGEVCVLNGNPCPNETGIMCLNAQADGSHFRAEFMTDFTFRGKLIPTEDCDPNGGDCGSPVGYFDATVNSPYYNDDCPPKCGELNNSPPTIEIPFILPNDGIISVDAYLSAFWNEDLSGGSAVGMWSIHDTTNGVDVGCGQLSIFLAPGFDDPVPQEVQLTAGDYLLTATYVIGAAFQKPLCGCDPIEVTDNRIDLFEVVVTYVDCAVADVAKDTWPVGGPTYEPPVELSCDTDGNNDEEYIEVTSSLIGGAGLINAPHRTRLDVLFNVDPACSNSNSMDIVTVLHAIGINPNSPPALYIELREWDGNGGGSFERVGPIFLPSSVDQTFCIQDVTTANYINGNNQVEVRIRVEGSPTIFPGFTTHHNLLLVKMN